MSIDPTIRKTITINARDYEIDMTWRPDEPAAGLREGWEECSVTFWVQRMPDVYLCIGFTPDYGKHVWDWETDGACVIVTAHGNHPLANQSKPNGYALLDETDLKMRVGYPDDYVAVKLGFLPGFCDAVEQVWAQIVEDEEATNAKLDEMLADAALADYERRMEP